MTDDAKAIIRKKTCQMPMHVHVSIMPMVRSKNRVTVKVKRMRKKRRRKKKESMREIMISAYCQARQSGQEICLCIE